MKSVIQVTGTLLGGERFDRYDWYKTLYPTGDGEFDIDGNRIDRESAAFALTFTPSSFTNQLIPVSVDDITRWTMRVRDWHLVSTAWSSAGYTYHHSDGTSFTYPATVSPARDTIYQSGYNVFKHGAFADYIDTFEYFDDEKFVMKGQPELDIATEFTGLGDGEPPVFIDQNPILITDPDAYADDPFYIPLGLYFNFNRIVIYQDGFAFEILSPPNILTSDTDPPDEYYLGALAGGGEAIRDVVQTAPNSLELSLVVNNDLLYPHGPGEANPGPPIPPVPGQVYAHDWTELTEPPTGLTIDGSTGIWKINLTATRFWTYSGTYDEDTGARLT